MSKDFAANSTLIVALVSLKRHSVHRPNKDLPQSKKIEKEKGKKRRKRWGGSGVGGGVR